MSIFDQEVDLLLQDDDYDLFAPSSEGYVKNPLELPPQLQLAADHLPHTNQYNHQFLHAPPDLDWIEEEELFDDGAILEWEVKRPPPHLSDDEGSDHPMNLEQNQEYLASEIGERHDAAPLIGLHHRSHSDDEHYFHESDLALSDNDLPHEDLLPVHDVEDEMLYDDDEILYVDEEERRRVKHQVKHENDDEYLDDDDDILRYREDAERLRGRHREPGEGEEEDDDDDLLREQGGRRLNLEGGQEIEEEPQYYQVEYKPRNEVIQLIQGMLDDASRDRGGNRRRYVDVVSRNSKNLVLDAATGLWRTPRRELRHRRVRELTGTYDILIRIVRIIRGILTNNNVLTKRDIYYQDPQFFVAQKAVDATIEDIACTIQVPRYCLNIVAGAKGVFAGPMQIISANGQIVANGLNGGEQGQLVPSEDKVDRVVLDRTVIAVLVIEKEGVFRTLLQAGYGRRPHQNQQPQQQQQTPVPAPAPVPIPETEHIVLITGKGYPDVATRVLLNRISISYPDIRILGIMDCDPHGLDILLTYKYGSISMAFDSESMAVPRIEWVGVFASDFVKYGLSFDRLMPLTRHDRAKAQKLMQREVLQALPVYKRELSKAWHMGVKAEIQCMDAGTLTRVYVPRMLQERGILSARKEGTSLQNYMINVRCN